MYTPHDKSAVAVDTGIKKAAGDPKTVKDHYKAMQVLGLGQTTSDGEVKVDTNNESTLLDIISFMFPMSTNIVKKTSKRLMRVK